VSQPVVYVNGAFVPEADAKISVLDHAVLYGDGVFETVFVWRSRIFKLDEHLDRCFRSMQAIALQPPMAKQEMRALIVEAVRRNGHSEAYLKWVVTRGSNGRPLMDPAGCVPNLIILVRPYVHRGTPERRAAGFRLKTVAIRRPSGQVLDPRIKSLNYLNLVLAKIEAKAAGADEALLLDLEGRLCEATGCNLFVVDGRRLRTPRIDILEGITRNTVMDLARERGFAVEEADLALYDAYTADELLICSTAGGILPATQIDGRQVGGGVPGPIFRELAAAYDELIASDTYGTPVAPGARPN
jgi:branched-chain amino acid aminotransferase